MAPTCGVIVASLVKYVVLLVSKVKLHYLCSQWFWCSTGYGDRQVNITLVVLCCCLPHLRSQMCHLVLDGRVKLLLSRLYAGISIAYHAGHI